MACSSFRRPHHLGEAVVLDAPPPREVADDTVLQVEAPVITEEIWMRGREMVGCHHSATQQGQ